MSPPIDTARLSRVVLVKVVNVIMSRLVPVTSTESTSREDRGEGMGIVWPGGRGPVLPEGRSQV